MSPSKKKKSQPLTEKVKLAAEKKKDILEKSLESVSISGNSTDGQVLTFRSKTVNTLEGALAVGEVDQRVWEVERWLLNKWDMGAKVDVQDSKKSLAALELWQVKVWFRRKKALQVAIEDLLEELKTHSPIVKAQPTTKFVEASHRRALEVCIMDPHMGMHCFAPESDHAWSMEDCEEIYMWALEGLLARSRTYAPFEEIVVPFGNDFMHVDNRNHTTTGGTLQPESNSHTYVFGRAIKLMVRAFDRLLEFGQENGGIKIHAKVIRGNHDEFSTHALGHVLNAYYHNNANVAVDASDSPYKFYSFGTNLIGFEHGHSISPIRLAALMANEVPQLWAATSYREWHLGDQHRKGSSKPSCFEEQGVSIEYLQALTPPNGWHRKKSFNWQKRGAVSYVWDHDEGPIARLQMNMNSYTGRPTGEKRK